MKFEIVKNLDRCKALWNKYTPKDKIWDEWDVACAFYDDHAYDLYFMLFKDDDGKELGLLPLYKDNENNTHYFFGEGFPEMRRFWFDMELLPQVFEMIPTPIKIFDMQGEYVKNLLERFPEMQTYFSDIDFRYYLNLKKLDYKLENYLKTFNKKHKKNFLHDLKKLKETIKYELIWEELEHIDDFINFNLTRFGKESDLDDKQFLKEMIRFLKVIKDMKIMHTLTIIIDGKVEGIEIAAFYMNKYYVLNGGYNREIKNLGKLLIFEHLKKALELKSDEIDLLVGDTGWKKLWNFDKEACYTFQKRT